MSLHPDKSRDWGALPWIPRTLLACATTVLLGWVGFLSTAALAQNTEVPVKESGVDVGLPSEKQSVGANSGPASPAPQVNSPKYSENKPPRADAGSPPEIPASFPASRYADLLEKSPFAIATAAPETVAPVENFASNWFLSSFSKSRSKDGAEVYTVFVKSRDLSTRLMLVGEKPEEGVTLVAVEEAPNRAETVAVLRKGSDVGRVKFDQAAFAAAPPPSPPRPGAPSAPPGAVNSAAGSARPVVTPSASKTSIPRPGMSAQPRSGVPATPSAVPLPGAVPPPAPPNGSSSAQDPRRRVRPIEAAPTPR